MAFQQGLSGLSAASKAIDVVSNNIANANTVGFKASSAQFADVFASALAGAGSGVQVGIGTGVAGVRQIFSQGNLTVSNNPLDMAINGNGFFRMQRSDGSIAYSRTGQFDVDRDGFIINAGGDQLTGFAASSVVSGTTIFAGTATPLQIDSANISPQATAGGQGVQITANLDSRDINPASRVPPGPVFNPALNPIPVESYNSTTSTTVYDSLGNPHSLTLYYVRSTVPTNREWSVFASLDGDAPTDITAGNPLSFDQNGLILNPAVSSLAFSRTAANLNNGAADLNFDIDMTQMTQFGTSFSVSKLTQNGFSTGQLTGLNVSSDGTILGRYSNGQSRDIGRLALANFASPNGLVNLGGSLWAESSESGAPIVGAPGTGVLGVVTAGVVEESNVDTTAELVNLIVQQRNYQANAQSIRTQDQILQTITNLR